MLIGHRIALVLALVAFLAIAAAFVSIAYGAVAFALAFAVMGVGAGGTAGVFAVGSKR